MCFSKRESILALVVGTTLNLIVAGTLINVKKYADDWPMRVAFLMVWQYALLMQIPEAAQWHHIDRGEPTPKWIKPTAYVLNTTQPIVPWLVIALTALTTQRRVPAWTSLAPIAFTAVAVLLFCSEVVRTDYRGIVPDKGCPHLNLHWWERGLKYFVPLYLLGVLSAIMAWENTVQRAVQSTIFVVSFLLSVLFYKCGSGSVWCWLIAPAGLAVLI